MCFPHPQRQPFSGVNGICPARLERARLQREREKEREVEVTDYAPSLETLLEELISSPALEAQGQESDSPSEGSEPGSGSRPKP